MKQWLHKASGGMMRIIRWLNGHAALRRRKRSRGGVFQLALTFPEAYPVQPPHIIFLTPCYHPNVCSKKGEICINILKEEWNPLLTVSSTLLCLSALLSAPAPEDPLNEEAAEIFMSHPAEFERTARDWTVRYACP